MDDGTAPTNRTAIVLVGGDPAAGTELDGGPTPDLVIAADGGLAQASRLGVSVDLVVGDLDSVDPDALEKSRGNGTAVEAHPLDKDATDLELAVRAAVARGATHIVVVGGRGGRLSHLLSVATVVAGSVRNDVDLEWRAGNSVVVVAAPGRTATINGTQGDLVSLVPVGDASGVSTSGLRWVLGDDLLPAGTTRGISNELTAESASVVVEAGVVLVVHERGAP